MKIRILLAWMLCFAMLFTGTASAAASGTGWLEQGLNWITEVTGLDTGSIKNSVLGWIDTLSEFAARVKNNPEVQAAWKTLMEGALQAGTAGKEAVTKAYHVVLDWWLENGEGITGEIASALDGIARAAGVDQADIAEWYSTVEEYIAESKDAVSGSVQEAWIIIKEAGTEAGVAAKETLADAYQTVRDWLEAASGKEAENAREAFGKIVNL